ncbi:MAG: hypothetical protein JXK05_05065 [Campylobacterales bacterium]|nr:hypothetical protein [Campylobacterales bacterium]
MSIIKSRDFRAFLLLLLGLLAIGLFYRYHHVQIGVCEIRAEGYEKKAALPISEPSQRPQTYRYTCSIHASFAQSVKVGIAVDEQLRKLWLNDQEIALESLRTQYQKPLLDDWERGFPFVLQLQKGENILMVEGFDQGGRFGLKIAQSLDLLEYLLLFVVGVLPLVSGLYLLLFERLLGGWWDSYRHALKMRHWLLAVVVAGIALRAALLVAAPNTMYQHDYQGHVDAIHYYAEHPFTLPQSDKSLQFPQQPLYYWISAGIYNAAVALDAQEHEAIFAIRAASLAYAALALFLVYAMAGLYLQSALGQLLFVGFAALTPSLVIMGAVVNNDALNALLGVWALYALSSYVRTCKERYFWSASLAIILAALTKISALLLALYFVAWLLLLYWREGADRRVLQWRILGFGLAVLLVFGFALLKAHVPVNGEFRFVNSALYGNQIIPALDFGYLFSFYFSALIDAAQSHVTSNDAVRFSLPTYLYGTMLMGEFDYRSYWSSGGFFKLVSQLMLFLGALWVVGLAAYLYCWRALGRLQQMLVVAVGINLLLVLQFLSQFWVVCNSDFRYFAPTFGAVGLIFAAGIERLYERFERIRTLVSVWAVLLLAIQTLWVLMLLVKV